MATYFHRDEYSKNRSIFGSATEVTKVMIIIIIIIIIITNLINPLNGATQETSIIIYV